MEISVEISRGELERVARFEVQKVESRSLGNGLFFIFVTMLRAIGLARWAARQEAHKASALATVSSRHLSYQDDAGGEVSAAQPTRDSEASLFSRSPSPLSVHGTPSGGVHGAPFVGLRSLLLATEPLGLGRGGPRPRF